MTGHQNRAERRSLQVIELRRIRSEFKKRTKGLSEGDKYFYYNAKKFRKSLFYYNLKKSAVNTVEESQMTSDSLCTDLTANINIGLPTVTAATVDCKSEPSVTTDNALLVSDEESQSYLDSPVATDTYDKEEGSVLLSSNDIDKTVGNAFMNNISKGEEQKDIIEEDNMINYQNRSERRRVKLVELRKIRSDYKKKMKNTYKTDKSFSYNAKKFYKTLFYYNFKKQTGGMVEELPMTCDTSCSEISTNTNIGFTVATPALSYQSEVFDPSCLFFSEELIQNSLGQGKENLDADNNHAVSHQDYSFTTVDENQMSGSEDISGDLIHPINTMAPINVKEEEADPSNQNDTLVVLDNAKRVELYSPVADIYQEEGCLISDTMVQAELYSPIVDTYKEEVVQTDDLVMLHDIEQTVESTDVSDIFDKDPSIKPHTSVAFGTVEKVTEDIHTTGNPEEEDTSLTSSIPKSFAADMEIPATLTLEYCSKSVFFDGTPIERNHHLSDIIVQTVDIPEETSTGTESEVTNLLVSEATSIMVGKKEGTVVEATRSKTGTVTVLFDKEQEVTSKDADITLDLERFKLELDTFSSPSIPMFDDALEMANELKVRTYALVNAGDPEDTKTSYVIEDKDKDQEEGTRGDENDWTEERSFISSDKANSGFSENSVKEITWIVTPPSSIASVLCEETASLITPPQSIRDIVFKKTLLVQPNIMGRVEQAVAASAHRELTLPPLAREKKKRLQTLRNKTGAVVPKIKKVWKKLFD